MAKKKADLVEEAEAAGVEDAEDLTVPELKEALAAPTSLEGNVRAVSEGGVAYLEFGSITPDDDEAQWEASHRHALTRDEAMELMNELPNVLQDANSSAAHHG